MPDVGWVGWADDIPPPGQRTPAKAARRRAARPGASTSVLDSLASAAEGHSALDDIVAAWAAPDPVARAESGSASALEGDDADDAPPAMTVEERWGSLRTPSPAHPRPAAAALGVRMQRKVCVPAPVSICRFAARPTRLQTHPSCFPAAGGRKWRQCRRGGRP